MSETKKRGMPPGMTAHGRDGRFVGINDLTAKQAAFVRNYAINGHSQTEAARLAGYGDPGRRAHELMRLPSVRAALQAARETAIADLATLGLARLRTILENPKPETLGEKQLQAKVAVQMLELAGHSPAKRGDAARQEEKPLAEMSVEELEAFIRRGRQALDSAAAPILDGEAVTLDGEALALPAPEPAPEDDDDDDASD